jgi:serine/threonine protein kinase
MTLPGHEGPPMDPTRSPSTFGRGLPPELAVRYTVVEELAEDAQADAILVAAVASGTQMVVKLYRRGFQPDEAMVARLAQASHDPVGHDHIVEIIEYGWTAGLWYEVLEYCRHGSLRTLMRSGQSPAVIDVVRQASAALAYVHQLGMVHRDLKPENILIRTIRPLDIVLGDFGIVRTIEASLRWTRSWGTLAYSPPEFERGGVSAGWDWWSLGIVVAELAGRRHPFELPNGFMLPDQQIWHLLALRPVDLSAVADDRVRLLCQGLLTRDWVDRWGAPQVRDWLAGYAPAVLMGAPGAVAPGAEPSGQVRFAGQEDDDARLADTLRLSGHALETMSPPFDKAASAARLRKASEERGLLPPESHLEDHLLATGRELEENSPPFDAQADAEMLRTAAITQGILGPQEAGQELSLANKVIVDPDVPASASHQLANATERELVPFAGRVRRARLRNVLAIRNSGRNAAITYHKRYVHPRLDFDRDAESVWTRALAARVRITTSEVFVGQLIDSARISAVLPRYLWEIAELLARLSALRARADEILREVDAGDPYLASVLNAQRQALVLAAEEIERRVRSLETLADRLGEADAATRRGKALQQLASLMPLSHDVLAQQDPGADQARQEGQTAQAIEAVMAQADEAIRRTSEAIRDSSLSENAFRPPSLAKNAASSLPASSQRVGLPMPSPAYEVQIIQICTCLRPRSPRCKSYP